MQCQQQIIKNILAYNALLAGGFPRGVAKSAEQGCISGAINFMALCKPAGSHSLFLSLSLSSSLYFPLSFLLNLYKPLRVTKQF